MKTHLSKRNNVASLLAFVSGILLILSGTNGADSLDFIREITLSIINITLVEKLFILMIALASFGGLTVILGGFLIRKNKILWARLLIRLGSGVGLISMLIKAFTTTMSGDVMFPSLFSLATGGILLAFAAQLVSKKDNSKNYFND